jgi:DNA polymerase III delta prime subunit
MHHAEFLVGSYEWACTQLPVAVRAEAEDVRHYRGARMGIEEVRTMTYEAHLTPIVDEKRTFVIAYAQLTHEAQNALLKLLEEPPATAQFFLITPRAELLLSTVRSRLHLCAREDVLAPNREFETFFSASLSERLTYISERVAKKDDEWACGIMCAIEERAHTERNRELRKALDELRPFYDTHGASRKMILEHLALLV